MINSNSADPPSNQACQYDINCTKSPTNICPGCGQTYCVDHILEHHKKLRERFEQLMFNQDGINQKCDALLLGCSSDIILGLIKPIHEFRVKSDDIKQTSDMIQQKIYNIIDQDKHVLINQFYSVTNDFEYDQNDYLENEILQLEKDLEDLQFKLEDLNTNYQKIIADEQASPTVETNDTTNDQPENLLSPILNRLRSRSKSPVRSVIDTVSKVLPEKAEDATTLSHLLVQQISPSVLDLKEKKRVSVESEKRIQDDETTGEEEIDDEGNIIVFLDSNAEPKINQKIRLANNIVRYLKGPLKIMVEGTMHAVDLCAQGTHINNYVLEAVKQGLAKQAQMTNEQSSNNNSIRPVFTEITSEWQFIGKNTDQGFSSPSIWMRDPQGRRILVKTQEHPLCAANEWLAYVLGRLLGLPVNDVQITVYKNNLVTLHTDVARDDEKAITLLDLPKAKRKVLMTDPIMASMDIFDRIIQNVDRNARNILITVPKTANLKDETVKCRIHLIDHASCFGMGKLNAISLVASKFHSRHLAVAKFDPVHKSKQFEHYLSKLPITDRPLISKTFIRFANISNEQFDLWITQIQDLLSPGQYNRMYGVLCRQRNIVKRYIIQWGLSQRPSAMTTNEINEANQMSEITELVTHL